MEEALDLHEHLTAKVENEHRAHDHAEKNGKEKNR